MYAHRRPVADWYRRIHAGDVNDEHRCSICLPVSYFALFYVRYTQNINSSFLMAQSFAGFMCFLAWASSTVSKPPAKRAVALALINTISQSGNMFGAFAWVKSWGPSYNKSYAICAAASLLCILMCLWLRMTLKRLNREMDMKDTQSDESVDRPRTRWRYHL